MGRRKVGVRFYPLAGLLCWKMFSYTLNRCATQRKNNEKSPFKKSAKKIEFFLKKVLTKEESFGKIIFADAPKGTNPKAAEAEMNLDN